MTKHRLSVTLVLLAATFAVDADHFKPATCTVSARYQGGPLYQENVELPARNFSLGKSFDTKTRQRLEQGLLEAMKQSKIHAMTAAVATTKGMWHTTRTVDGSPSPHAFTGQASAR